MKVGLYLFLFILFTLIGTTLFYWEETLNSPTPSKTVVTDQAVSKPHSVTEDQVSCHPIFPVKGKYLVVPAQEEESSSSLKELSFLLEPGWPKTLLTSLSSLTILWLFMRAILIKKNRYFNKSPSAKERFGASSSESPLKNK